MACAMRRSAPPTFAFTPPKGTDVIGTAQHLKSAAAPDRQRAAPRRGIAGGRSPIACGRGHSDEFIGQAHLLGPGKPLYEAHRAPPAALDDPVGAARHRQDHAGATDRRRRRVPNSSRSRRCRPASRTSARPWLEHARCAAAGTPDRCCSWMRCTASTRRSRTRFLPHVEDGTLIFIGATTENPSFEIVGALLSRARVYVLKALSAEDLAGVARCARSTTASAASGLRALRFEPEALRLLARAGGWGCAPGAQHAGAGRGSGRGGRRIVASAPHRRAGSRQRRPAALRQGRRAVLRPDLGTA